MPAINPDGTTGVDPYRNMTNEQLQRFVYMGPQVGAPTQAPPPAQKIPNPNGMGYSYANSGGLGTPDFSGMNPSQLQYAAKMKAAEAMQGYGVAPSQSLSAMGYSQRPASVPNVGYVDRSGLASSPPPQSAAPQGAAPQAGGFASYTGNPLALWQQNRQALAQQNPNDSLARINQMMTQMRSGLAPNQSVGPQNMAILGTMLNQLARGSNRNLFRNPANTVSASKMQQNAWNDRMEKVDRLTQQGFITPGVGQRPPAAAPNPQRNLETWQAPGGISAIPRPAPVQGTEGNKRDSTQVRPPTGGGINQMPPGDEIKYQSPPLIYDPNHPYYTDPRSPGYRQKGGSGATQPAPQTGAGGASSGFAKPSQQLLELLRKLGQNTGTLKF